MHIYIYVDIPYFVAFQKRNKIVEKSMRLLGNWTIKLKKGIVDFNEDINSFKTRKQIVDYQNEMIYQ